MFYRILLPSQQLAKIFSCVPYYREEVEKVSFHAATTAANASAGDWVNSIHLGRRSHCVATLAIMCHSMRCWVIDMCDSRTVTLLSASTGLSHSLCFGKWKFFRKQSKCIHIYILPQLLGFFYLHQKSRFLYKNADILRKEKIVFCFLPS